MPDSRFILAGVLLAAATLGSIRRGSRAVDIKKNLLARIRSLRSRCVARHYINPGELWELFDEIDETMMRYKSRTTRGET
jgi:hypothetical protein